MTDQISVETPDPAPRRAGPLRPRRLRRILIAASSGTALAAAAWFGGLVWFAANLPDRIEDEGTVTDAIVVLTGGSERLTTGLTLLAEQKAHKLLISGVYRGVEIGELLRLSSKWPEEWECCIALGYEAGDTIGNAAETALWMRKEGFRSVRLVTSNYHMPRSLLEFGHAMPGVTVIPHPVFPNSVKQDQWWRWPGTAHLIATEYTKYLAAAARHRLMMWRRPT